METNGLGGLGRLHLGVVATALAIGISASTLGDGTTDALGGAVAALAAGLLWYRLTAPGRGETGASGSRGHADVVAPTAALGTPDRQVRRPLELPDARMLPGSVAADVRRAAGRVRAIRSSVEPGSSFDRELDNAIRAVAATAEAWTALPAPVPDATYRAYCRMVRHQVAEVTRLEADLWASRVGDPAPPFTCTSAAEQMADVAPPQAVPAPREQQPRADVIALHERRVASQPTRGREGGSVGRQNGLRMG